MKFNRANAISSCSRFSSSYHCSSFKYFFYKFRLNILGQDCSSYSTKFNCASIIACQTSSGVCQCANGNQCVWNNDGNQTVNCPCYDQSNPTFTDGACATQFNNNKCGYETTCNSLINAGTCKCPDGSTCIWNDQINLGCPCSNNNYPDITTYRNTKLAACATQISDNNCPLTGVINCMQDVGSCTCNDGTLCAWGPNYSVNCPCA